MNQFPLIPPETVTPAYEALNELVNSLGQQVGPMPIVLIVSQPFFIIIISHPV